LSRTESETLGRIHSVAEKEFLEKGFKDASLRNIVKTAGVTTGAFYGYYKNKEELFEALVKPMADYFFNYHKAVQEQFNSLEPGEQWESMGNYNYRYALSGLKFAYENFSRMKLLLTAAGGTRYESFLHDLVEMEIASTNEFILHMEATGMPIVRLTPFFEHTIISGMYKSFFELIIHDIPYEEAMECFGEIYKFYQAGWEVCMGMR